MPDLKLALSNRALPILEKKMPRSRKDAAPSVPEDTLITVGVISGTPAREEEAAKEYKPANLGPELNPYRIYSDKFFSPIRQQAMAEKRRDSRL